jgi:hypothetical protein
MYVRSACVCTVRTYGRTRVRTDEEGWGRVPGKGIPVYVSPLHPCASISSRFWDSTTTCVLRTYVRTCTCVPMVRGTVIMLCHNLPAVLQYVRTYQWCVRTYVRTGTYHNGIRVPAS